MENALILDDDEIKMLTGRVRHDAQAKELSNLGIECRKRGDGSLVVLRAHVEKVLGGEPIHRQRRKTQPRFDLVR